MAVVFSKEIEAILTSRPVIDWDAITAQLKEEFIEAGGKAVSEDDVTDPTNLTEVYDSQWKDAPHNVFCTEWPCFRYRHKFDGVQLAGPLVKGANSDLRGVASDSYTWLTFSAASVAELNRRGIDRAVSVHGAPARSHSNVVIYRGATDDKALCDMLVTTMLDRIVNGFVYVTAWDTDNGVLAEAVRHLRSVGGRVCPARGGKCDFCMGTGRVKVVPAGDFSIGEGGYCLCSYGDWVSVRDDEREEIAAGASLMGWPDGDACDTGRRYDLAYVDQSVDSDEAELYDIPVGGTMDGATLSAAPSTHTREKAVFREEDQGLIVSARLHDDDDMAVPCDIDSCARECLDSALVPWMAEVGRDPSLVLNMRVCDWVSLRDGLDDMREAKRRSVHGAVAPDKGFCYTLIVRSPFVGMATTKLSAWPTFRDIMDAPWYWFSFYFMLHTVVNLDYSGADVVAHIDVGKKPAGHPLFSMLVDMATVQPIHRQGSFGELLVLCGKQMLRAGHTGRFVGVDPSVTVGADVSNADADGEPVLVQPDEDAVISVASSRGLQVRSWFGDSIHDLDVRVMLVSLGLDRVDKGREAQKYVAASAQARYYKQLENPPAPIERDWSDHRVSQVFEANYYGRFREDYLMATFGSGVSKVVETLGDWMAGEGVSGASRVTCSELVSGLDGGEPAWCVIMPPGHGKSFRHGLGRLRAADQLCGHKSTQRLVDLWHEAFESGVWTDYEKEWANGLRLAVRPGDVVMISRVDVAEAAGFRILASLLLDEPVWRRNVCGRSVDRVARCAEVYRSIELRSGLFAIRCPSNEALSSVLDMCCRPPVASGTEV